MGAQIALLIVGSVFSTLLTFAVVYLREIKKSVSNQNEKHDELQKELSNLKEALPKEYVRREDWIISFGKIEQKIDAIWKYVHQRQGGD